jgi:hypothetical protein
MLQAALPQIASVGAEGDPVTSYTNCISRIVARSENLFSMDKLCERF